MVRIGGGGRADDAVAVEEPVEIRLGFERRGRRVQKPVSVTMRTPGNDFELAAGFLFAESILTSADQVREIRHCGDPEAGRENDNVVRVELADGVDVQLMRLERHFYTTSSCGVCGKTSLEALEVTGCAPIDDPIRLSADVVHALPDKARSAQEVFASTGGLHAAALFDADGTLLDVREDVGRHNAMDKLVGSRFLTGDLPMRGRVVLLSGRASFELLQKALMARVPVVAAVGAPSSLAVELAEQFGITLLGFVRAERFNVYTHPRRIDA